jgi:hypothetical protein
MAHSSFVTGSVSIKKCHIFTSLFYKRMLQSSIRFPYGLPQAIIVHGTRVENQAEKLSWAKMGMQHEKCGRTTI